jgi:hypothetical protein
LVFVTVKIGVAARAAHLFCGLSCRCGSRGWVCGHLAVQVR